MKNWVPAATSLAVIVLFASATRATVLTFDGLPNDTGGNLETTPAWGDYGDNVDATFADTIVATPVTYGSAGGATPNVAVTYSHTGVAKAAHRNLWFGGPDVVSYMANEGLSANGNYYFTFTAAPGYGVYVTGFHAQAFNGDTSRVGTWALQTSPGGPVIGGHSGGFLTNSVTVPTGMLVTESLGSVTLEISSDIGGNLGIDDIQFSEILPEPGSLALVAISGLLLLRRRK